MGSAIFLNTLYEPLISHDLEHRRDGRLGQRGSSIPSQSFAKTVQADGAFPIKSAEFAIQLP